MTLTAWEMKDILNRECECLLGIISCPHWPLFNVSPEKMCSCGCWQICTIIFCVYTHHVPLWLCAHVCACAQALDSDRLVLQKMRKAAKAKYTSGQGESAHAHTDTETHTLWRPTDHPCLPSDHVSHLEHYISSMEKLSVNCHSNGEMEVGSAFCRLADFSRELVSPMKNLVSGQSASCQCTPGVRGRSIGSPKLWNVLKNKFHVIIFLPGLQ